MFDGGVTYPCRCADHLKTAVGRTPSRQFDILFLKYEVRQLFLPSHATSAAHTPKTELSVMSHSFVRYYSQSAYLALHIGTNGFPAVLSSWATHCCLNAAFPSENNCYMFTN